MNKAPYISCVCSFKLSDNNRLIMSLLTFGLFALAPLHISAQNVSDYLRSDAVLKNLMQKVDSVAQEVSGKDILGFQGGLYNWQEFEEEADSLVLNVDDNSETGPFEAEMDELLAEKEAYSEDYGFSFRAGYRENIEEGIFSGGDIFYLRRFNVGFQWNILSNGLFSNSKRVDLLEVREKMLQKDLRRRKSNARFEQLYNLVIYVSNREKIEILEEYHKVLSLNLELFQRLHYLDLQAWESVLELSTQKARLESNMKAYREYNNQFEKWRSPEDTLTTPFTANDWPVFDIDIDSLTEANKEEFERQALTDSDLDKLTYRSLSDISLNAYADYNIYDGIGNQLDPEDLGGREYISVGLSLSIPLPLNTSEKKRMANAQKLRYRETERAGQFSEQKELLNHYYEYKSKLQQYFSSYGDYLARQDAIERQQALRGMDDGSFSVQRLMHSVLQRYQIALELTNLKQQMYLLLINMDMYLPERSIIEFAEPVDLPSIIPGRSSRHQAEEVYLWSQTVADIKENGKNYLNGYIEMLAEGCSICKEKNLRLSVSIPYYFEEILQQVGTIGQKRC